MSSSGNSDVEEAVKKYKERGNVAHSKGDDKEAKRCYTKALDLAKDNEVRVNCCMSCVKQLPFASSKLFHWRESDQKRKVTLLSAHKAPRIRLRIITYGTKY